MTRILSIRTLRLVVCFLACCTLVTSCGDQSDTPARNSAAAVDATVEETLESAQTPDVPESSTTPRLAQVDLEPVSPSPDGATGPPVESTADHTNSTVGDTERTTDDAAPATGNGESIGDDAEATTENADTVPQLSARGKRLAWLADDSMLENFPAATARAGHGTAVSRMVLPEEPLVFTRPAEVRGLYINAWGAGSRARSQRLIDIATRTEVNSLVIDIKDATGYVSHATSVAMAREVGADQEIRIRDLIGLLERLHEADIYPIARIVIVKDPLLIRARPDLAVQDTAGGVWVDSKGLIWANLHDRTLWEYHVELAKEVAAAGFPEIQWDYLRFPDAPRADLDRAVFPGADGRTRRDAVEGFLEYARAELAESGVEMTLDVFGATTSATSDIGIGQYWERFIGSVDVALPMVYPSHYWAGSFGIQDPNGHPYEIIRAALRSGLRRSDAVEGAGKTRPWLQDFTLGSPRYGAPEVRAQIQATYDAGIREWVLWNASSRYTEAALAPAAGYPAGMEPTIRVGGRIVPVSERYAAMQAEADALAEAEALARAEAERIEREKAAADTTGVVMQTDTLGVRR